MSNKSDCTEEPQNVRPQFGTRFLKDEADVFKHNAWDNVEWTEEQEQQAQEIVKKQLSGKLPEGNHNEFVGKPHTNWDKFYEKHDNKFFKDRHWLFTEFPELLPSETSDKKSETVSFVPSDVERSENVFPGSHAKKRFLEVGCGAGNTIFPVLRTNNDPDFFMCGCDYSSTAVDIVRSNPAYDEKRCFAFVHDIANDEPYPFPDASFDIIIMIFVLSALTLEKRQGAVDRLAALLKPGGVMLFRDYGRYDMAQLRFKSNRCLGENFYSRGDGTLVYFFTQDEVRSMFTAAGLTEEQNLVDRRLQVNRARQLKMFRVWIQAKYRKPVAMPAS